MPAGLRAADAPRIQELCQGDKRLLMRVGALLQSQLSISEAVLEEITHSPEIRKMLMDRTCKDVNSENFAALAEQHGCQDIGLILSNEAGADQSQEQQWRCIHLEDELNNIFAQEAVSKEPASEDGHQHWAHSVNELLPTLHASVRTPLEGLLAAKGDDQRAAAIEQLRYAAPSLTVVAELMPIILADGADIVRERGIGLLTASGASPVVTDIIRALQRDDKKTLQRLSEHVSHLPLDQKELVFAAIVANVSRGDLSQAIINISCHIADVIANHRGLDRFLELLLLHSGELGLVRLVRLLQEHNAIDTDLALRSFLGQSPNGDAKIIIMLAHPKAHFEKELMQKGVDFLVSQKDEPKDRMGLANALRRMTDSYELGSLLAQNAHQLEHTRDSTVFWLLAEMSRDGKLLESDADTISEQIRIILRKADGPHTVSILDQQLPALLSCGAAQRERMVEPLAELLAKFRDERSHDQIHNTLTLMRDTAIAPLWRIIKTHPRSAVRVACANVMPDILSDKSDDDKHEAIQTLRTESKQLQKAEEKGHYYLAAAKLIHDLDDDRGVCLELNRECELIGSQTIDASAYLAASKHMDPDRRLAIVDYLINLICADLPKGESSETIDPATDEITYVLDTNLSLHTDLVPRALTGLEIISKSTHLPQQLLRRLCMALIGQWRKVSRWEVIWGPANIHHLAKSLADIAGTKKFPESLRLQVAEALVPRANQIKIAEYLVRVFTASHSKRIHEIAARAAKRILKECNNNQYAEDEYGDLSHILARYLILPNLDTKDEILSTQIARTLSMYQSHCSTRTRELLVANLDKLRPEIADQIEWLSL